MSKSTLRSLVTHCGGPDLISETQKLAARRVATLEAELIFLEDKFGLIRQNGDEPSPMDVQLYGQLADRQRRLSDP
jgi:acetylglutamate kinase